jgi:alpha-tubulin suppressor-like RCC1 family protein
LGAGVGCAQGEFSDDHSWSISATNLRFVSAGASGDGLSAATAAGSIEAAINGLSEAVVLIGEGEFSAPAPLPASLTLIGNCAAQTSIALGEASMNMATGGQLRLWGLTIKASNLASDQALVSMNGEGILESQRVAFASNAGGLLVQGEISLEHNDFGAIAAHGIGARGPLSGVIIGDNHFLGPLGGDGVFLGPLGGDGVFRISDNTFRNIVGSGIIATDIRSGVIIGDNHFLGPLGGDGVFLGPADNGDISVSGNRFDEIAGNAITLQDVSGNNSIENNEIKAPVAGGGGSGIVLLDAPSGGITVSNNQIIGATSMAVIIERVGADVLLDGNLIEGTLPPINTGGDHLQAAYAVAAINSKNLRITGNIVRNNASAGVVHDMGGWGSFLRRPELRGEALIFVDENSFSENNDHDFVIQNGAEQTETAGGQSGDNSRPANGATMPMGERHGHMRCLDGRTNGVEDCDSSDPLSQSVCKPGTCELRDQQRSSSGSGISCFVASDHQLYCAGQNTLSIFEPGAGNDDNNSELRNLTKIALNDHAIVSVAAGRGHVCVLTLTGQVGCWGAADKGQLGNGSPSRFGALTLVVDANGVALSNISGIAAYKDTSCAWSHGGELYCWGENSSGQAGAPPRQTMLSQATLIAAPADGGEFKVESAAVGDNFTCLLTKLGKVRCFGQNNELQLGVSPNSEISHNAQGPIQTGPLSDPQTLIAESLSAARGACATTADNNVYCWGATSRSAIPQTETPELVVDGGQGAGRLEGSAVQRISMGEYHGCIQSANQDLKCWGAQGILWSGSIGDSQASSADTVRLGDQNLGASPEFSAGLNHTCAMLVDRKVYCWGLWLDADGRQTPMTTTFRGTLP